MNSSSYLRLLRNSILLAALLATATTPYVTSAAASVRLARVPESGLQPSAAIDPSGIIHLVYLVGDPARADVHYARLKPDGSPSAPPMRVNSQAGAAVAIGTIRGPQLALGRNHRPHIVWNGNGNRPGAKYQGSPLLYSRLADDGRFFTPERDLIHTTSHLDGGAAIAADTKGNVHVLWHGQPAGSNSEESDRAVVIATSTNDGRDFIPERVLRATQKGACACCGMRAHTDAAGRLFALYRNAATLTNRNMSLAVASLDSSRLLPILEHPWTIPACPMSSAAFAESSTATYAAWETAGQIYYTRIPHSSTTPSPPSHPPANPSGRKHPAIAVNHRGEVLLAWTEGTAWKKAGTLAWQLLDANSNPTTNTGSGQPIPVWGAPAALALPDNTFLLLH